MIGSRKTLYHYPAYMALRGLVDDNSWGHLIQLFRTQTVQPTWKDVVYQTSHSRRLLVSIYSMAVSMISRTDPPPLVFYLQC